MSQFNIDMKYSLVEILEAPKRLRSLSPLAVLAYAQDAANHSKERFISYIRIISNYQQWCITSLMLATTDIFPLKTIFKDDIKLHDYQQGSLSLNQTFNEFIENLSRGRFNIEDNRVKWLKKMEANLSKDDLELLSLVINQKGFDAIRNKFKELYNEGLLDTSLSQWFSFAYTDKGIEKRKGNDISSKYIALKSFKRIFRIFDMYFIQCNNNKYTTYKPQKDIARISSQCMKYVKNGESLPHVSVLYLDEEDYPILQATPTEFYALAKPKDAKTQNTIPIDIADGAKYLVEIEDDYSVKSFTSFENGMMELVKVNVESSKEITFPYLGKTVNMLWAKGTDGNDYIVYVPENTKIEIDQGENSFVKYNGNYILTK